jgi:hypothetical protein
MNASFEERSVWVQLVSTVVVLGGYFVVAWRMMSSGVDTLVAYVPLFAGAVILLVIVLIAGSIVAAFLGKREGRDERDRLISWRAESNSGWILAAGVLTGITAMILSVDNVWVAHLLLLSLLLSEVAKYALQLVYYRRGI